MQGKRHNKNKCVVKNKIMINVYFDPVLVKNYICLFIHILISICLCGCVCIFTCVCTQCCLEQCSPNRKWDWRWFLLSSSYFSNLLMLCVYLFLQKKTEFLGQES